jgi:hypothetical protein
MKLLQIILFAGLLTPSLQAGLDWGTEESSDRFARAHMQSPIINFEPNDPRLTDLEQRVRMSPNPFLMLQGLDQQRGRDYKKACQLYETVLKDRQNLEADVSPEEFERLFQWHFDTELTILMYQRKRNSPDSEFGQKLLELHQRLTELPRFVKRAPEGALKPLVRRK